MSLFAKYFIEKMKNLEKENAALRVQIENMDFDMKRFHEKLINVQEEKLIMSLILSKRQICFTPIRDAKLGDCNYLVNVEKGDRPITIHNAVFENEFKLFIMNHNDSIIEYGGLKNDNEMKTYLSISIY